MNVPPVTELFRVLRNAVLLLAVVLCSCCPLLPSHCAAALQTDEAVSLDVFPPAIELSGKRDFQKIIGQAVRHNGVTQDVSNELEIVVHDENIARLDGRTLVPLKSGETNLRIRHAGLEVTVPVKVAAADVDPPISFQLDVMPVFARTGCNSGSCHGAARGKDGFQLSLFGYDPEGDYFRLTREMLGRRIDVATPDDCMLSNKATGKVAHSGGAVFSRDSDYYRTLKRWLVEGAEFDGEDVPEVLSVTLMPPSAILDGDTATQQMSVSASYSDGTTRDVTDLAYFSTTNASVANVSKVGVVAGVQRGEAFVMARFGTHTVGAEFVTLPKGLDFEPQPMPVHNFIDERINKKLNKLRITPSDICTDDVFIRRVSLDVCGTVPTANEVGDFVADQSSDKRSKLIDRLLEQDAFVSIWVMKWSQLLQIRSYQNVVSPKAALLYHGWLKEKISTNTPVDELVTELLGATGSTFANPPANFYEMERDPLKISENVAQSFMGMRIQCAQCHNHPFDRWTMEDYYSFASFFAPLGRKAASDPRERIVVASNGRKTKHPVSGEVMEPKFLGGAIADIKGKDRRIVLAQWLTAKENPYFSRNLSNIVWAHFFGRGIIDEVDDVRVSNPPVNEPLLAELARNFSESGYDFKQMVRDICNSRTYQLSTASNETNASDLTNFSHAYLRRLPAEILLDVVAQVTGTQNKFKGLPTGARAIEIADGNTTNYFLQTFGRSKRESVCSCEVKKEPNLSQALHLINGDTVEKKIRQGNLIGKWQSEKLSDEEIIEHLYLRALGRMPEAAEVEKITALFEDTEDKKQKRSMLEDVFWALLNSSEFLFNH